MSGEHTGLRGGFANPPREYAPRPSLLLNDDLSEEAVVSTLEELASKGIGEVFLHPRAGLEVEYFSAEYWDRLTFVLDTCGDLGLYAWLCDEYNWPSGPVAGGLLRARPEYRQRHLDYLTAGARAGSALALDVPGELLVARAMFGDEVIDVAATTDEGKLSWTPPASGNVVVFFLGTASATMPVGSNAPWMESEQPGCLDVLNDEAVSAFMQRTHLQYDERLSDYYGVVVKGVYTQEPGNYHGWQWTARLPEVFGARKGYDLLPSLHELVWDVGDYVRTRSDYHEVARDLYVESFYAPIAEWASERGLGFSGTVFRESDLARLPGLHGEAFTPLSAMSVPGVRWASDTQGRASSSAESLSAASQGLKLVSSVAHAGGSRSALVEVGGGAGWGLNLADLRAQIDESLALGVGLIKPQAVHLSLKGMRKRDFPPAQFTQEPWWRYYLDLVDYSARLSYLLSQGSHVADIALLYPTQSLWLEYTPGPSQSGAGDIVAAFRMTSNALLRLQRDFDYVSEESVVSGESRAEAGKLVLGEETFSVLVLPPLRALPVEVLSAAQRMVTGGGTVLALGRLPTASRVRDQDPEVLDSIEAIWGPRARRLATGEAQPLSGTRRERVAERIERIHYGGGRAVYVAWSSPLTVELAETILTDLLADGPPVDLSVDSPQRGDFVYLHRRVNEEDLYFVVNLGSRASTATLSFPAKDRIERWDALTGEVAPVLAYQRTNGRAEVSLIFSPGSEVVLVTGPGEETPHVDQADECEVADLSAERAEVRVLGEAPRLRVDGREFPVPTEQMLPPLRFRHDWLVERDDPNTWLLEPWSVRVTGGQILGAPETGSQRLRDAERLGVRARLTVGALRGVRKLARQVRPPVRSIRTPRFMRLDELTRRSVRLLSTLGIDARGLYAHEILRLVRDLGQETGVGLGEAILPPGAHYEATASFYADFVPPI